MDVPGDCSVSGNCLGKKVVDLMSIDRVVLVRTS
jgi:hypothetical protein